MVFVWVTCTMQVLDNVWLAIVSHIIMWIQELCNSNTQHFSQRCEKRAFVNFNLDAHSNYCSIYIAFIPCYMQALIDPCHRPLGETWSRFLLYKYAIKAVLSCIFEIRPIVTRSFKTNSQIQMYNFIRTTYYRWTSVHKYTNTKSTICMYINSVMNICNILNLFVGVSKSFKWVIFLIVHL